MNATASKNNRKVVKLVSPQHKFATVRKELALALVEREEEVAARQDVDDALEHNEEITRTLTEGSDEVQTREGVHWVQDQY